MKAVGYYQTLPIDNDEALIDITVPTPKACGQDILVAVKAVAVNPLDIKIRTRVQPEKDVAKILGWDAAGIVTEVGPEVRLFQPGDEVWYAGDLTRAGTNSEFHLVNEELVAKKPNSLNFIEAAALPLTSLTAWEILFDRLQIPANDSGVLLVTGAAGGVGSILVQLARRLTKLTVIGTASRPDSKKWILDNGAHHVIDHTKNMLEQLQALNITGIDYAVSLTHTDDHASQLVEALKPAGKFALIDDPKHFDILAFKSKSLSIHWESMFTRSFYKTSDKIRQHEILAQMAQLVDQGIIKTTLTECFGTINANNLKKAHALIESGTSRGKLVLSEF